MWWIDFSKMNEYNSSINISLTYLRGLEVAELTEADMPMGLITLLGYEFS
jgi:hypothetical protein